MNIVNDILVNTLFPDTDFVQTLSMNSVVPKYVENQEKGNPSVCKNCAEAPFKDLHIYGRSEQMTTTGAQLFDAASIKKNDKIQVEISDNSYTIQMTTTINESGSPSNRVYIAINHVIEGDFSGKTVTLSYDGVNSDVPNERYAIGLMYNTDDGRTHYLSLQKDMPKSISVTLPENTTNLTLRLFITEFTSPTVPAGTYTVTIQGAMLTEGSEKKDWEPYTGGKPSPSPDYPQEIVNAGKDGNLNVMVRGKNLLELTDTKVQNNNLKFEINKGSITFSGTADGASFIHKIKDFVVPRDGIYTISTNSDDSINESPRILISVNGAALENAFAGVTKELSTGSVISLYIRVSAAGSYNGRMIKPMIEKNSEGTVYEPYHEPQSMPVTTPNGLPGIPVSSGGNYTDENGQQWICDEVNLERGVYVQRVDKGAFDATKALTEQSVILATPIETPLTATEIAAYKSLRTYRGTTIVEAEDKAGISVKYNMPMPKLSKNGALRRWFKRHPII